MPDNNTVGGSEPDVLRHHTPSRLKLVGFVIIGVAALVVVIGLAARFFTDRATKAWTSDQAIPTVQLITLKGTQSSDFALPGDVQAYTNATINAQISGTLQKWFVDIGAPVKVGQLLAQIDPRSYQAALDQARGQLARDSATLADAQLDLKRYQTLAAQEAISAQQLSTQQATVNSLGGTVETDRAAVQSAAINLGYTRIVAPIDGVVTSRAVDVGQLVNVGTATSTPLFTVTDQSRLRIYVRVPQTYSGMVRPGMTANFTVPEYPGRSFTAVLAATADAIVSQSGTQLLQMQVENKDRALKPGSYAEMHFTLPHGGGGVRVPVTALIFRDAGMLVATVGEDNKVALKPIHITTDVGTAVDVGAGLKPGDRVIDNPPDSLRAGDIVRVAQHHDS